MLETFTAADFDPESAAPWTVHLVSGATVDLKVVSTRVQADPRPFSVLFAGPLSPELQQGTFAFTHEPHGQFSMFIVPVARTPDAMHYEAVFG